MLKQVQVFCVECTNGDIHLILKDSEVRVRAKNCGNFEEAAAIKKIMKEEALKPLFLKRDE
jgi:uncharacterized Zn finger protein